MDGPEGATTRVNAWLALRLPVRVAMLRRRLNVDEADLPAPATVLPYDKLSLGVEEWPAVLTAAQELRAFRPLGLDNDGVETYAATYTVRIYALVRGDGEAEVDVARKRYVLAIREALLERKTLRLLVEGQATPLELAVSPASIRESYSDLAPTEAGTIAGAWLSADVTVEERLEPVNTDTAPPADMPDEAIDPVTGAVEGPYPHTTATGEHTADTLEVVGAIDADTDHVPTHPALL